MYFDRNIGHVLQRISGGLLLLLGCFGLWYALRVAKAQILYHRIKFREPAISLVDAAEVAERSHQLYPHNYHLSQWLAEKAWYEHTDANLAMQWLPRGLRQNPYRLEMRWLETVLVGREDPEEAARMWEAYSDEVFWNRWVLAGRVYWLAYAGRVEEAEHYMQILQRIGGDHSWAEQALAAAKIQ